MKHAVSIYVDTLDQNPTITTYDTEWEALEAANDAIDHAVQWRVDHSPYSISEDELDAIREEESLLVKITKA